MAEGVSMIKHLNECNTIITPLISVSINFNDEVRTFHLSFLPESWNGTIIAVSSSVEKKNTQV